MRRDLTPKEIAQIKKARAAGMSFKQLAGWFGVGEPKVKSVLNANERKPLTGWQNFSHGRRGRKFKLKKEVRR